MSKMFVEIEDGVYENLQAVAERNGLDSVEKLLEEFAAKFSTGCSVTILKKSAKAA